MSIIFLWYKPFCLKSVTNCLSFIASFLVVSCSKALFVKAYPPTLINRILKEGKLFLLQMALWKIEYTLLEDHALLIELIKIVAYPIFKSQYDVKRNNFAYSAFGSHGHYKKFDLTCHIYNVKGHIRPLCCKLLNFLKRGKTSYLISQRKPRKTPKTQTNLSNRKSRQV